jgi:hypothetical protein
MQPGDLWDYRSPPRATKYQDAMKGKFCCLSGGNSRLQSLSVLMVGTNPASSSPSEILRLEVSSCLWFTSGSQTTSSKCPTSLKIRSPQYCARAAPDGFVCPVDYQQANEEWVANLSSCRHIHIQSFYIIVLMDSHLLYLEGKKKFSFPFGKKSKRPMNTVFYWNLLTWTLLSLVVS